MSKGRLQNKSCNKTVIFFSTFPLLELKLINICHQFGRRPACISMKPNQALDCCLVDFKFLILISLEWDIPKTGWVDKSILEIQQGKG